MTESPLAQALRELNELDGHVADCYICEHGNIVMKRYDCDECWQSDRDLESLL